MGKSWEKGQSLWKGLQGQPTKGLPLSSPSPGADISQPQQPAGVGLCSLAEAVSAPGILQVFPVEFWWWLHPKVRLWMWGGGFKDLLSASADWEVQGFLWGEFIDSKSESDSRVRLFATPWTIQSMEFSRPE